MSFKSSLIRRYRGWELSRHQARQMRDHGFACYNWWRREAPETFWFYLFLQRPRLAGRAGRYRIGFCSVFGERRAAETAPCDLRIFFTGENLVRFPGYADHLLPVADLSLGFDNLDAPNYLRLPLWILMCFPPDASLPQIEELIRRWQAAASRIGDRPPGVASLVARHDRSGIRRSMAGFFENVGTVRYGGAFGTEGMPVIGPDWSEKQQFLSRFPFNICPENSDRTGYVTEKLFHAVAAGCIPLYWGAGNEPEPEILNQNSLILFNPDKPESFTDQLAYLVKHPDGLTAFARQDRFLPGAAEAIYEYYRRLEDRLLDLLK